MMFYHLADLHFSPKEAKLAEVVTVSDFIIERARVDRPRFAVLAGDTVDEYDGRIRLDSPAARAAISFVERLADVCPVLILRGTPSHDRNSPYIFGHLGTRHPVYVSQQIEQVALTGAGWSPADLGGAAPLCVVSCVPSVEKSWLMAQGFGSIAEVNAMGHQLVFDVLAGFGVLNDECRARQVPTVLVAHGTVTGAEYSTGTVAVGEDLEFALSDLAAAQADYVALGHIHKHQVWTLPGGASVCYAGSPGRLNFGETEPKGFVVVRADGDRLVPEFVSTPARRLVFHEVPWDTQTGADGLRLRIQKVTGSPEIRGADLRFRFSVPEEFAGALPVAEVVEALAGGGPRSIKVERRIIPRQRQRAAGISSIRSLPEKVALWGETVGVEIAPRVLDLAAIIEGKDTDELVAESLAAVDRGDELFEAPADGVAEEHKQRVLGAIDGFVERQLAEQEGRLSLF